MKTARSSSTSNGRCSRTRRRPRWRPSSISHWTASSGTQAHTSTTSAPTSPRRSSGWWLAMRREAPSLIQLLRGERFVDLHTVVREAFASASSATASRSSSRCTRFERRLDLRDAALARRDLELALELGDAHAITDETRARVAVYNGDDCLSTESLRTWLERRRARYPGERREHRPPGARRVGAQRRGQRTRPAHRGAREALLRGLPADRDARTADDKSRRSLAAMLGYYRQERQERLVGVLPPARPAERRTPRRARDARRARIRRATPEAGPRTQPALPLSFPGTGDGDRHRRQRREAGHRWPGAEPETARGTVGLDLTDRTIVLSVSDKAMSSLPKTVFRDPVVSANRSRRRCSPSPNTCATTASSTEVPTRPRTNCFVRIRRAAPAPAPAPAPALAKRCAMPTRMQAKPSCGCAANSKAACSLCKASRCRQDHPRRPRDPRARGGRQEDRHHGRQSQGHRQPADGCAQGDNASSQPQHLRLVHKDAARDDMDGIEVRRVDRRRARWHRPGHHRWRHRVAVGPSRCHRPTRRARHRRGRSR